MAISPTSFNLNPTQLTSSRDFSLTSPSPLPYLSLIVSHLDFCNNTPTETRSYSCTLQIHLKPQLARDLANGHLITLYYFLNTPYSFPLPKEEGSNFLTYKALNYSISISSSSSLKTASNHPVCISCSFLLWMIIPVRISLPANSR